MISLFLSPFDIGLLSMLLSGLVKSGLNLSQFLKHAKGGHLAKITLELDVEPHPKPLANSRLQLLY